VSTVGKAAMRAVFLDRDGTLNRDVHYLSDPGQVELLPGVAAGVRRLRELKLAIFVVSNQSGIARGHLTEAQLLGVNRRLQDLLAAEGGYVDGVFWCPHHPDEGCWCRKPGLGMVEQAAAALPFLPSESYVIGDRPCDVELGAAMGAKTVWLCSGPHRHEPHRVRPTWEAPDFLSAVYTIEAHLCAC